MASLGGLVAGIAHDINTPIGIGVTALSRLVEDIEKFETVYNDKTMSRSDLEVFLNSCNTSTSLTQSNLERAAELVQSFKQVAIDQTSEDKRKFKLKKYLDDIIVSLHPKLKKAGHNIDVRCDDELELNSFPGFISQIVTNLVLNSVLHAYDDNESGNISIEAEILDDNTLSLVYTDDGKGMAEEIQSKIFEPFFTTKRSQGGSGLGLHIVYNIVNQKLNGAIKCESHIGKGTKFVITFPLK